MNTSGNRSSQHLPAGGGLVGAIEVREREKKELKQGINSQAVRQAIVQQQRQSPTFYDQRNSQMMTPPNFHQQTQQFVHQQSQFSKPQYPQPHSPHSPGLGAQSYALGGPQHVYPRRDQSQMGVQGEFEPRPPQQQGGGYANGRGQGGAYQGRGNGY